MEDHQVERRFFQEVRVTMEGERRPIIEGYAARFNEPSEEIFFVKGWREIIRPGAFANAIKNADTRALIDHDMGRIIGRVSNGTLHLEETDQGLLSRIYPPDTSEGRDIVTLIRGGYLSQMSFGFTINDDGERLDQQNKFREILSVKRLYDVSVVAQPAYPSTTVGLRHAKIAALSEENPQESLIEKLFESRIKEREEFFLRRTPPADPLSYFEILRRCRIK